MCVCVRVCVFTNITSECRRGSVFFIPFLHEICCKGWSWFRTLQITGGNAAKLCWAMFFLNGFPTCSFQTNPYVPMLRKLRRMLTHQLRMGQRLSFSLVLFDWRTCNWANGKTTWNETQSQCWMLSSHLVEVCWNQVTLLTSSSSWQVKLHSSMESTWPKALRDWRAWAHDLMILVMWLPRFSHGRLTSVGCLHFKTHPDFGKHPYLMGPICDLTPGILSLRGSHHRSRYHELIRFQSRLDPNFSVCPGNFCGSNPVGSPTCCFSKLWRFCSILELSVSLIPDFSRGVNFHP